MWRLPCGVPWVEVLCWGYRSPFNIDTNGSDSRAIDHDPPRTSKVCTARQGLPVYYKLKSLGLAVESLDDAFVMDLNRTVRMLVIGSETSAG